LEAEWFSELVWTHKLEEKSVASARDRTSATINNMLLICKQQVRSRTRRLENRKISQHTRLGEERFSKEDLRRDGLQLQQTTWRNTGVLKLWALREGCELFV
jgi:hypothetical protein